MKETSRPTLIQYIDKIVGVPGRAKHQVTTAPARGTTDARDPGVQKKTLVGTGIVMAEDPWSSHRSSRLKVIDDRAVMEQHTVAIRTVQETAEVLQRQQLDRVVDVALLIQPAYSKRSPRGKLGDVDDGFVTTGSELAAYSGEATGDACPGWHGACL